MKLLKLTTYNTVDENDEPIKQLTAECSECGTEVKKYQNYCWQCGEDLKYIEFSMDGVVYTPRSDDSITKK